MDDDVFVQYVGGKLRFVLGSILLLILVQPFLDNGLVGLSIYALLLASVPLAAVYAFSYDRSHLIMSRSLGVVFILVNWTDIFIEHKFLTIANSLASTIFFGYIVVVIMQFITRDHQVNKETIFAALSGYLLLGFMWVGLYGLADAIVPPAFSSSVSWGSLVYYSFSALTTLGIGDIAPVSSIARILTILESVTGVLFTAVLIATLIGRSKRD